MSTWIAAHRGGQTAHDTEAQAEAQATWLVKSRTAVEAVIYEIETRD